MRKVLVFVVLSLVFGGLVFVRAQDRSDPRFEDFFHGISEPAQQPQPPPLPTQAPAETEEETVDMGDVWRLANTEPLNIRRDPGKSNEVIGQIPGNQEVLISVQSVRFVGDDPWVLTTHEGTTGWIALSDGGALWAFEVSDAAGIQPVVNECGQARDLGPWAPVNIDGTLRGENFEVTANAETSAGVWIQLWWPNGTTLFGIGTREVHTFVSPGLSIEVQAGAGRGFDFERGCSIEEIRLQGEADMRRRSDDTSFAGFVDVDDIVEMGLARIRFDRRETGNIEDVTPSFGVLSEGTTQTRTVQAIGTGFIGRDGDADGRTIGASDRAFLIEAWEPVSGTVLVPVGESISGVRGANWAFGSTEAALA